MAKAHRCGLVALVGAPNAGKSTLLNALVGDKLSIVSPKPQTTRLNLRGILSRPDYQMVFVDTPGLLTPRNPLEKGMRSAAESALKDADWVLLLASLDTEKELLKLQNLKLPKERSLLLLTKLDALSKDQALGLALRLLDALNLSEVLKVSAKSGEGLEALLELLASRLPEGPSLFPEDELSDTNIRELCAEIVREKALFLTRDEVPHALAVALDRYVEREDGLHEIEATLYVERESQKGIVIGSQGKLLKEIGTAARKDMERLVGAKVFLKLWVKVRKDWKKDTRFLKELGIHSEKAS